MKHIGLFEGIGGFSFAAKLMNWETIANTNKFGLEGFETKTQREFSINRNYWSEFPTQSPICNRNDGISFGLDGITFPKWRNESIKALGNALVPQVVYEIYKTIALCDA